jgi:hypothetical protein
MPSKTRNRFDLTRFLDQVDSEILVVEHQKIIAVSDNLPPTTQALQLLPNTADRARLATPLNAPNSAMTGGGRR